MTPLFQAIAAILFFISLLIFVIWFVTRNRRDRDRDLQEILKPLYSRLGWKPSVHAGNSVALETLLAIVDQCANIRLSIKHLATAEDGISESELYRTISESLRRKRETEMPTRAIHEAVLILRDANVAEMREGELYPTGACMTVYRLLQERRARRYDAQPETGQPANRELDPLAP